MGEIAQQRRLRPTTIASHLERLILNGETVNLDRLVSEERPGQNSQCPSTRAEGASLTEIRGFPWPHLRLHRNSLRVRAVWQMESQEA